MFTRPGPTRGVVRAVMGQAGVRKKRTRAPRSPQALLIGLLPPMADWALATFCNLMFEDDGGDSHGCRGDSAAVGDGLRGVGTGALLNSLVLASLVIALIDRKFGVGAAWSAVAAALSLGGLAHGSDVQLEVKRADRGWRYAVGYAELAAFFVALLIAQSGGWIAPPHGSDGDDGADGGAMSRRCRRRSTSSPGDGGGGEDGGAGGGGKDVEDDEWDNEDDDDEPPRASVAGFGGAETFLHTQSGGSSSLRGFASSRRSNRPSNRATVGPPPGGLKKGGSHRSDGSFHYYYGDSGRSDAPTRDTINPAVEMASMGR